MFEYSTGWMLQHFTGACPWDYSHVHGHHIDGIIRLDYGPCWIGTGTMSELMYPFLDSIAFVVSSKKKED